MKEYNKPLLVSQINRLEELILAPEHQFYFSKSGDSAEEIRKLFERLKELENKWGDQLQCNYEEEPDNLIMRWETLYSNDDETEGILEDFHFLYKKTIKFLRALQTIPYRSLRRVTSKSIAAALEKASNEKVHITEQLEMEKSKELPDEETIRNLEKLKEASDEEMEALRQEKGLQEFEEASERDWNEKITAAFKVLRLCSKDIEDEYKRVCIEYKCFLWLLLLPSAILTFWIYKLYEFISSDYLLIIGIESFIPYYIPVPVVIALFWVFIVQKNRAGKLSIALSERLYQIKYVEGLLATVNRLAPSSHDAIENINKALEVLVNGYLQKVAQEPVNEKKVEDLEKKEISQDLYLRVIEKLTDKL